MKKWMSMLLALAMLLGVWTVSAAEEAAPSYLTPSVFIENFNAIMEAQAEKYADSLGEENVNILREYYTITEKDPQGSIVYYGTKEWEIEVSFYFPDTAEPEDATPAKLMNFNIRKETPEIAAYFARFGFGMMIAYEYQDEELTDALLKWIDDPAAAGTVSVPGYSLTTVEAETHMQYVLLPESAEDPAETADQPAAELPEEDRALLTVYIGFEPYVLGVSTPKDMIADGWILERQTDGTFILQSDWGVDGVYVYTEHGELDEPILTVNMMWGEGTYFEYHDFDGLFGYLADDPDQIWYPGGMSDELYAELVADNGSASGIWQSFANWLAAECGGTVTEEGITNAVFTLSDGRPVYVSSHDSPARVSLVGFED